MLCEVILTSLEDHQQVGVLVGLGVVKSKKPVDNFSADDIYSTQKLMTLVLNILCTNLVCVLNVRV